jgi:hypothetical protein
MDRTKLTGHVGDGVAPSVRVAEATEQHGSVRVDCAKGENQDGTGCRTERDHARWDRQDTRGENDLEKDERRLDPADCAVVDTALDVLEDL